MKYSDGSDVKVGDKVRLGRDENGVVVCSIDDHGYNEDFPESQWAYLKEGVMINFPMWGLIHYAEPEEDLKLLARKS